LQIAIVNRVVMPLALMGALMLSSILSGEEAWKSAKSPQM